MGNGWKPGGSLLREKRVVWGLFFKEKTEEKTAKGCELSSRFEMKLGVD